MFHVMVSIHHEDACKDEFAIEYIQGTTILYGSISLDRAVELVQALILEWELTVAPTILPAIIPPTETAE